MQPDEAIRSGARLFLASDDMFDTAGQTMDDDATAAIFAARNEDAQILGVFDVANKTDAAIDPGRLGEAVQFVGNASILGYDVRAAMVMYGKPGTPSLRAEIASSFGQDTERLCFDWNQLIPKESAVFIPERAF